MGTAPPPGTALGGDRATSVAEREAFRRDGHVCVRGLFDAAEIAVHRDSIVETAQATRHETRDLAERDTYGQAFLQCTNLWAVDERVRRFVFAARTARVAAELLGADSVHLYHDQALIKEAGGGHTPWHQDQFFWPFPAGAPCTVTAWIPLHDVDPHVGALTFASGSHIGGDLGGEAISDESEISLARLIDERGWATTTHDPMVVGDATFHAGWTLHRAGPNPTGDDREVMTVIYVAGGTPVTEPASPFQAFDLAMWLPGLAPGDVIGATPPPAEGPPMNPRLWPG